MPTRAALELLAKATAQRYEIDEDVFLSLINFESGWNPRALSPAGAMGLGQVMPFHWKPGEDPYDPASNLDRSARILRSGIDELGGNVGLGLAAYFAGAGTVKKAGGRVPDVSDVNIPAKEYVRRILTQAGKPELIEQTPGLGVSGGPKVMQRPEYRVEATAVAKPETGASSPKKDWLTRAFEAVAGVALNLLPSPSGPAGPGDPSGAGLGSVWLDAAQATRNREAARNVMFAGRASGSLTDDDIRREVEAAPIGVYETAEERRERHSEEVRTSIREGEEDQARRAQEQQVAEKTGKGTLGDDIYASLAEKTRRKAAVDEAQLEINKKSTEADALINMLAQQIAAGNLSARLAELEVSKIYKKNEDLLNQAKEKGERLETANKQFLEASQYAIPPGTEYVPGMEPGGSLSRVAKSFGRTNASFTPMPMGHMQFSPYNQVEPSEALQLGTYPAAGAQGGVDTKPVSDALRRVLESMGIDVSGLGGGGGTPSFSQQGMSPPYPGNQSPSGTRS